jgi:exopolyphosphatase/guanosine-5'-triphosphate,3'-diphosphate pyrophosphatase
MQNPKVCGQKNGFLSKEQCLDFVSQLQRRNRQETAAYLGIEEEQVVLLFCSAMLMKRMLEVMDAKLLWAPGVTLCDGIVYEYAEKNRLITIDHDFEKDILACCENISKRYMGSRKRSESVENISLTIFDSMRKLHGMKKRERFLLQLSAKLYDCGKYMSMTNVGECSYDIIMATEIIGLSHQEREMVANIVKYNRIQFDYDKGAGQNMTVDRSRYLTIAKLTAILKLANGLDRSHKQKFKKVKAQLRENELILTVDTSEDITLEKSLIGSKAQFFEEVFHVRPVIRQKRTM